ncbi:MAG: hypothetical protein HN742_08350 [Lentisphaerae bacterium]|nr:hypothetical protein [Lentisphaerota bacterium]MBT7056210.1 hypothetical protein [Lentisphaerota bacterium]MBT7841868.1 hypothetical protein [Lentisphaerota bacterium]
MQSTTHSAMGRSLLRFIGVIFLLVTASGCLPWPSPKWSPDGRQIAFVGEDGLWVAEGDTWKTRAVQRSARLVSGPVWSADGSELFFLEASTDCRQIILKRVAAVGGVAVAVHCFPASREVVHGMVFGAGAPDPEKPRAWLHLALNETCGMVALELPIAAEKLHTCVFDLVAWRSLGTFERLLAPAWSPDGSQLACVELGAEGRLGGVRVFAVRGEKIVEGRSMVLSRAHGSDFPPSLAWSPDSRRIVTTDGESLWLLHADGSKPAAKQGPGGCAGFLPSGEQLSAWRSTEGKEDKQFAWVVRDLSSGSETFLARQSATAIPALTPLAWGPREGGYASAWYLPMFAPLLRISQEGRSRPLAPTLAQKLFLACALDMEVFLELEEDGALNDVGRACAKAIVAYGDLLSSSQSWRGRPVLEARLAFLKTMLGHTVPDVTRVVEGIWAMEDGPVRNEGIRLAYVLLLSQGDQAGASRYGAAIGSDERREELQRATRALTGVFGRAELTVVKEALGERIDSFLDGDVCALGRNCLWEARSADQAVGRPDAFGAEAAAWQPGPEEGTHWLEVSFGSPVPAQGLAVMQSPMAGGIVAIDILGGEGAVRRVIDHPENGIMPNADGSIPFTDLASPVHGARIYVQSSDPFAPNGIDAVKLLSRAGDRWATGAHCSSGRSDPLPSVSEDKLGTVVSPFKTFSVSLTGPVGVHEFSTTNGRLILPAGDYSPNRQSVEATDDDGAVWELSGKWSDAPVLTVTAQTDAELVFGFPLSVEPVLRVRGDRLTIDMALRGKQGQVYGMGDLRCTGRKLAPPAFEVRDAEGAIIRSGELEYG